MKFRCVKEKIKNAIAIADRITNKNASLPVLGSVLLRAGDGLLKIRATNLDLGVEIQIPSKIEKNGSIAVPGNVTYNLLSHLLDDAVEFEVKGNNLHLSTKNNSAIIKSYPSSDFPTLPEIKNNEAILVPAIKLLQGFRSVWYSAALSDIKPEIASVCLYTNEGNLVFVATDSFRLAEKTIPVAFSKEIKPILIPYKNSVEIMKILETVSGDVSVFFDKNQIVFKNEFLYLTSRITDGVFPDYKQIVPVKHNTESIVLKSDLLNSLKTTTLFSDKFNQVSFYINPEKNIFEINSKNEEIGENNVFLHATVKGDPFRANFNQKYIHDCFQSITTESVSLETEGEGKPLLIKGVGDRSFVYLVMPLNQ